MWLLLCHVSHSICTSGFCLGKIFMWHCRHCTDSSGLIRPQCQETRLFITSLADICQPVYNLYLLCKTRFCQSILIWCQFPTHSLPLILPLCFASSWPFSHDAFFWCLIHTYFDFFTSVWWHLWIFSLITLLRSVLPCLSSQFGSEPQEHLFGHNNLEVTSCSYITPPLICNSDLC